MTSELDTLLHREWEGTLSPTEAQRLDTLCSGDETALRLREQNHRLRDGFASFEDETPAGLADRIADRVLLATGSVETSAWTLWGRSVARAAVILITFGVVGVAAFQIGNNTDVTAATPEHERKRADFLESLDAQKPQLQRDLGWDATTIDQILAIRAHFWDLDQGLRQKGASGDELRELYQDEQASILRALTPDQRESWRRRLKKTPEEIENLLKRTPR